MSKKRSFIVEKAFSGAKLRDILLKHLQQGQAISSKQVRTLIDQGCVTVNGKIERFGSRIVQERDVLCVSVVEKVSLRQPPLPVVILYEDDSFLAIDKPAGCISSIDDIAGRNGAISKRWLLVHRLDKDTSGVLLIAKNEAVRAIFEEQFRKQEVTKTYLAIVHGRPKRQEDDIIKPLALKQRAGRQVIWNVEEAGHGMAAFTHYKVQATGLGVSFVVLTPKTGRTHQLRIHLESIGCPIVGEKVYGGRLPPVGTVRHLLHAYSIGCIHPVTKLPVYVKSPLPQDFVAALSELFTNQAKDLICEYSL